MDSQGLRGWLPTDKSGKMMRYRSSHFSSPVTFFLRFLLPLLRLGNVHSVFERARRGDFASCLRPQVFIQLKFALEALEAPGTVDGGPQVATGDMFSDRH